MSHKAKPKIWAFDCETDPFLFGREPVPFAWGAVCEDGDRVCFWGDNATAEFIAWADTVKAGLFIAHNGGKFDALFLRSGIEGEMLVMDGRIVRCNFLHHEMRDSYAILPMPLARLGAKGEIDYSRLERPVREQHRAEITKYMMQDCVVLLDAVIAFYASAGKRRLTVASTAFAKLKKTAQGERIEKVSAAHDAALRRFYFGGRVQYFEQGIIEGDFKLFDVNSMYPHAMTMQHPMGMRYRVKQYSRKNLPRDGAYFASVECVSNGAFPVRDKKSTSYVRGECDAHISGHELNVALECGLVEVKSGLLFIPEEKIEFGEFVNEQYSARLAAKARGDKGGDIFHKLMLNSAYGKLASSPEGKEEIYYCAEGETVPEGWKNRMLDFEGQRIIASRPVQRPQDFYNDVGIGASITGAARSILLRAIAKSKRVLYCDTDSILCEQFGGGELDDKKLGAWKFELDCDVAAIAGKKMYTLLKNKRPIKSASKGVRACPTEIYMAAAGERVMIDRDAPTIGLRGINFVSREIGRT